MFTHLPVKVAVTPNTQSPFLFYRPAAENYYKTIKDVVTQIPKYRKPLSAHLNGAMLCGSSLAKH